MAHIYDSYFDKTLRHLSKDATVFIPIERLFKLEHIPVQREIIMSIVDNLEANGHIDVKCIRYGMPEVRIKAEGVTFITKTSYEKETTNPRLRRVYHLSGTTKKANDSHIVNIITPKEEIKKRTLKEKVVDKVFWPTLVEVVKYVAVFLLGLLAAKYSPIKIL